jgi:hypothetical protein
MSSNILPELPRELVLIIISDVLANFLHSRIFLPKVKEWDAILVLSLVSKEFLGIVQSIWNTAVGPLSAGSGHSWR